MKDLNTLDYLNKLCEIGVTSLKIEGRLRRSEYVYIVVNSYRKALDAIYKKEKFDFNYYQTELKKVFSRDFTKGYIFKDNEKINFDNPRHSGEKVGEVVKTIGEFVFIRFDKKVENQDALRIITLDEEDGLVINDSKILEKFKTSNVLKLKAHSKNLLGGIVYKTSDFSQTKEMHEKLNQKKFVEISGKISLENDYLSLEVTDGVNVLKELSTSKVLVSTSPNFLERIIQQVNKSQNYNFLFKDLKMLIDRPIFLPVSEINELRRRVLDKLKTIREQKYTRNINKKYEFDNFVIKKKDFKVEFIAYTEEQLQALNDCLVGEVYVPYDLFDKYNGKFKEINLLYLEERIADDIKIDPKKTMMQTLSNCKFLSSSIYLNVTNIYAVNLLHNFGIENVGLSIELNKNQIFNLVKNYNNFFKQKPSLSVMVYGRYSLMITKNCFIKEKYGCKNCKSKFIIKDRMNNEFIVVRRKNCIIEILNSKRLNLLNNIEEMKNKGIKNFLVYFTVEDYEETYKIVKSCKDIFEGGKKDIVLEDVTFGYYNL